jgi:hypothetical protein
VVKGGGSFFIEVSREARWEGMVPGYCLQGGRVQKEGTPYKGLFQKPLEKIKSKNGFERSNDRD